MRAPIQRGLSVASALGVALALSSCEDEPKAPTGGSAAPVPSTVATTDGLNLVTGEGRSAHFDAVASHLHVGGEVFGYLDVDGDVEKLADMIQSFLKKAPAGELPPHIAKLDLPKVLADLGLDGIEAIGMSSYDNGELYHNRAFLYVPEGRKGLLKVFGGDAGPFNAHSLAPADSDLVIEQTINIRAAYEVASKMVMTFGGEEAYAEFRSKMGEMNPQLGLSMADLLGKLDTRATIVGRVHPDKPLEIPDAPMEIPSFDLLIAMEDVGWLYEKVTGNMKAEMPADQAAQMFVKGDGFEKIALPPMPSPDMAIAQPVIHHDIAGKRVYIASSQAFLDECLSGKTTLADSADFKTASAGLPTEGNGLSYTSANLLKTFRTKFTEAAGEWADGGNPTPLQLFEILIPKSEIGQAEVIVNEKDGIFLSSNSTSSMKEGILIGGATFMGVLGATTMRSSSMRHSEPPQADFAIPHAVEEAARAVEAVPPPAVAPPVEEE